MERAEPESMAFGRTTTGTRYGESAGVQLPLRGPAYSTSSGTDGAQRRYPVRLLRFIAGWAGLGVVLTSATQLRSAAAPIGPGEILLSGWVLFVSFLLLRGLRFTRGQVFRVLAAYWLISAVLLGFGSLVALTTGVPNSPHDAFAFLFVSVLTCLLALQLFTSSDYHEYLARFTFFTTALCAALLVGVGTALPSLGPIDLWFGPRFRGWAENPNQLGLFVAGMPFLGWYLLRRSRRFWHKVAYGLAIACCIWVGLATQSDALRVAWAAALVGIGALTWCRAALRSRGERLYLSYITSYIVVPIAVVTLGYTYGPELVERIQEVSQATYEEGDQGGVRAALWSNGIEAIARSPLVGFGPGSHSGVYGPFEGAEAHNSFIDWGMSTGTLGVVLHLGLLIWSGWRAVRSNSLALLALVASLAMYSVMHYTFRQPIYWLLLVLCLALTERRSRTELYPAA